MTTKISVKKLLLLVTSFISFAVAEHKMPTEISEVIGMMPHKYDVVYTQIKQDPATINNADVKPIVTRTVLGSIGPSDNAAAVNRQLTVPQQDINLNNKAGAFPDIISKIAGAIDPRAGLAASGASAIVNEALRMASNKLNEKFHIKNYEVNLVEILPSKYYRINSATNEVQITQAFKTDLKKYNELLKQYLPIAKEYNKQLGIYQRAYSEWKASDPLEENQQKEAHVSSIYNNDFKPILIKALEIERKLSTYALQRISIMASTDSPGTSCSGHMGSGPWRLYLYYFVGAKQTNMIAIDYCVKDTNNIQKVVVKLNPNRIDPKGNFKPGGVQLEASLNNPSVSFPVQEGVAKVNYSSPKSQLYSWFDEMVTSANGAGIETYMFPFDIYNLKAELAQKAQDKNDKEAQANLDKLDSAIQQFKSSSSPSSSGESPLSGSSAGSTGAGASSAESGIASEVASVGEEAAV